MVPTQNLWLMALSVVAFCLVVWVMKLSRQLKQVHQRMQRFTLDNGALARGSVGVGKRLHDTCDELQGLKQKCRVLENREQQPSYDQACHLVELGATVEDLMTHCGFPRSEAELLVSLSRKKRIHAADIRSIS